MANYEALEQKLQAEELPFWGKCCDDGCRKNYATIKEAREAGLTSEADKMKDCWQKILKLPIPEMRKLTISDYEEIFYDPEEGEGMETDEQWKEFHELFEGKTSFSIEYVIERALIYEDAFSMLDLIVLRFDEGGFFDK